MKVHSSQDDSDSRHYERKNDVNVQHPEFTDEVTVHIGVTTIIITTKRMFMAQILIPMMNRSVVSMQYTYRQ